MSRAEILISLEQVFPDDTAKLAQLDDYIARALVLAGEGNDVVLTGAGPVWLYLKIAHALHGKARKLIYRSPVTGDVVIFDHSPD
jgi:CRISPR-associated Csx3 family protein